mmetsp:Transcript_8312/g.20741  ORF Transcript_8312/g.20741 Transcript_8312/m.20741 type:complete len:265 (-) Transcript_8312:534-1328(-)
MQPAKEPVVHRVARNVGVDLDLALREGGVIDRFSELLPGFVVVVRDELEREEALERLGDGVGEEGVGRKGHDADEPGYVADEAEEFARAAFEAVAVDHDASAADEEADGEEVDVLELENMFEYRRVEELKEALGLNPDILEHLWVDRGLFNSESIRDSVVDIVLFAPPRRVHPEADVPEEPRKIVVDVLAALRVHDIVRGIVGEEPGRVENHADHDPVDEPVLRKKHKRRDRDGNMHREPADVPRLHFPRRLEETHIAKLPMQF